MDTVKILDGIPDSFQVILQGISSGLGIVEDEIDTTKSFTSLGGDSLAALTLANFCRVHGYILSPGSILRTSSIDILKGYISVASFQDDNGSAFASDHYKQASSNSIPYETAHPPALNLAGSKDIVYSAPDFPVQYPHVMTEMQMNLVHGSIQDNRINIISFYDTYRTEHLNVLKESWSTVMRTEPIFRSGLLPEGKIRWSEATVTSQSEYQQEISKPSATSDIGFTFKIVTLAESGAAKSISTIIWQIHHSYIDGYSASRLYTKVRQLANGLLISPGPSFANVVQQLRLHQYANRQTAEKYWRDQYVKFPSAIGDIGSAFPSKPRCPKTRHATINIQLPHSQVMDYAKLISVTPSSLYCTAWGMTLGKLVDSDQVCFGMIFSGRDLPILGVQEVIGPLLNSLPFFLSTNGMSGNNALDLVQSAFRQLLDLSSIQTSEPKDGFKRQFGSVLATQFEMEYEEEGSSIHPIARSHFEMSSDMPISILIGKSGDCTICFHADKFTDREVDLMGQLFQNAILTLLDPQRPVLSCLDGINSSQALQTLLEVSNFSSTETFTTSKEHDLVTLFERNLRVNPGRTAVAKGKRSLTYLELDLAARKVAHALSSGVAPGEAVCVYADRSINWIVAIYGILKAGGVYAPLDPAAPVHVLNMNFNTSGARIWVAPTAINRDKRPSKAETLLVVEEILEREVDRKDLEEYRWRVHPDPDSAAYICFTSGSTGRPKAVCCTHMGLVAFQKDEEVRLFAGPGQKVAQIMSPAFDGSIHEIFSAISYGATLMLPDDTAEDPFHHLKQASSAILTPSLAKVLNPTEYSNLQNVYLVGEAVPQYVCDQWAVSRRLYNMYGPTEATCGATIKRLLPQQVVTIGRPNPSTRVYILDHNLQLAPLGVIGFIYLAGIQVSKGYIGQPEETARVFKKDSILDCFEGDSGHCEEMMYKTGDRGFWDPISHELHYLGRVDRQIKLRGFRLDLNDLEIRILKAVPNCTAAAVIRQDDHLVAVLQPTSLNTFSIRPLLAQALPPYAMPRYVYSVDKFPLTPVGKLDYSTLLSDVSRQQQKTTTKSKVKKATMTMTATEKQIAETWRQLLQLGVDMGISPDSDFIALGGSSLLQLQLANQLSVLLGRPITVRTVIESPILQDLAKTIDKGDQNSVDARVSRILGKHGVSPIEADWFWKYQMRLGTSSFNVSYACTLDPQLIDIKRLGVAWNQVLARHSILQSQYSLGSVGKISRYYSRRAPQVRHVESINFWREINREFDLEGEDPVRVMISENSMLLCISHIICDLTTLRLLLEEVVSTYNNNSSNATSKVSRSFQDTHYSLEADSSSAEFWKDYLHEIPASVFHQHQRRSYKGTSQVYRLPCISAKMTLLLAERHSLTLHQIALALVFSTLQVRTGGCSDMVLGSPFLNREREDANTIGLFLQPLPVRIRIPSDAARQENLTTARLLKSIRQTSQSALSHALPWNQLLDSLGSSFFASSSSSSASSSPLSPSSSTSSFCFSPISSSSYSPTSSIANPSSSPVRSSLPNHPLFDVMVTFHDERNTNSPLFPLEGTEHLVTWAGGSKFTIMFEFSLLPDNVLLLRVEYDDDLFPVKEDIDGLQQGILLALDCLVNDTKWGDMKRVLVRAGKERERKRGMKAMSVDKDGDAKMVENSSRGSSDGASDHPVTVEFGSTFSSLSEFSL